MLQTVKDLIQDNLVKSLKDLDESLSAFVEVEVPADKSHGEFASNIALKSCKILKKSPLEVAQTIVDHFRKAASQDFLKSTIEKIEVKKPGFINFYLTPRALQEIPVEIFQKNERFGHVDAGKGTKLQIEFVSANPTGPLSVAHARQAAVGDALGNIFRFLGYHVTKEYYVNDQGNQINLLAESLRARALEICGEDTPIPENGYQGEYIRDMAQLFMDRNGLKSAEAVRDVSLELWKAFGVEYLLGVIKEDLKDFNVVFDTWSFESKIAPAENIPPVLDALKVKDFVYESDGALWFRSTALGDDKDRVVRKSDGAYTYLTPDIVYHKNKYDRGFQRIFNIWGPDHHGYIPRIKAAVEALGNDKDSLEVLIVQLATIYRDGKPLSMSTRRGEFISLREVIDEVGVDAARYFFMMRHIKAHLEFDLDLAKKQSSENPVYYIQYAHARIHSINKKAAEGSLTAEENSFSRIMEAEEIDLIKKLGTFPDVLMYCHNQRDPFPLVNYLLECATAFHRFYDTHKVITEDQKLSSQRLGLANATRIVLANGLSLLGLSTPDSM